LIWDRQAVEQYAVHDSSVRHIVQRIADLFNVESSRPKGTRIISRAGAVSAPPTPDALKTRPLPGLFVPSCSI
jgi:hypothetical protein